MKQIAWTLLGAATLAGLAQGCRSATCGRYVLDPELDLCVCPGTRTPPDTDGNCPSDDAGVDSSTDVGVADGMDSSDAGPAPDVPTLRFPWNGFRTGSARAADDAPIARHPLRPRFIWEGVDDADAYRIQLTRSCDQDDFRTCDFGDVDLEDTTEETTYEPAESLEVSFLVPVGARYYWRVAACSGDVCSEWSDVRYVNVGRSNADFNGDGYGDLFAESAASALFFWGTNTGYRATPDPVGTVVVPFAIADAGDLNGDGRSDLAFSADELWIMYGGDSVPATPAVRLPNPLDGSEFGASANSIGGDLDADGYDDLVVVASGANQVHVYPGAQGGITTSALVFDGLADSQVLATAVVSWSDVNGDGHSDIALVDTDEAGAARLLLIFGRSPLVDMQVDLAVSIAPLGEDERLNAIQTGLYDDDAFADVSVGFSGKRWNCHRASWCGELGLRGIRRHRGSRGCNPMGGDCSRYHGGLEW